VKSFFAILIAADDEGEDDSGGAGREYFSNHWIVPCDEGNDQTRMAGA
jgi:hypothetical protein